MSDKRTLLNYRVVKLHTKAEWLVFIHGAGGNMSTWKQQEVALKPFFNLLFLDLRDHGGSQGIQPQTKRYSFKLINDDLNFLLAHLGIHQAHFMTLSMGSLMIQDFALRHPHMIRSVVVAGGVYHISIPILMFVHSALFFTRFLPYRLMYRLFSYLVMPRKNHQLSRKIYVEQSKKLSGAAYRRWITLYQEFRQVLKSFYGKPLEFPLLVVMGSEDYIFLEAARRYVNNHSEMAELEIMPHCGHICTLEKPALFNQLVVEFYQKLGIDGEKSILSENV